MDRWTNRIVLVTGASSGIGRSIVVELSKYPIKIVALARRIGLLQVLTDELLSSVAKIYPIKCDVTNELEITKVFQWIENKFNQGVSVMINNAGTLAKTKILDGEVDDWKNLFDVNVIGTTICCKESYKSMKKFNINDGHVININSTAAHSLVLLQEEKMYNSTKTAFKYLTEGFRHELAISRSNIKVTSINPGKVNTETVENNKGNAKPILSMEPKRVAEMVILTLTTPSDILIADLTVLSVGETIQAYPPPLI